MAQLIPSLALTDAQRLAAYLEVAVRRAVGYGPMSDDGFPSAWDVIVVTGFVMILICMIARFIYIYW